MANLSGKFGGYASQKWLALAGLALAVGLAASPLRAAEAGASDWSQGLNSAARLVDAGGLANGSYRAGVEVKLGGGSHTYWRQPGEAGAPPVFAFEGSTNLAAALVRYPAPTRMSEAGVDIFGYRDQVIFPVKVTPVDPTLPVDLALDMQYAACDRICVPAEAHVRLLLAPAAAPTAQAAAIDAFVSSLPKPVADGGPSIVAGAPRPGKEPAWPIAIAPAPGADADLFAEAPDGWYFDTKRTAGGFDLVLEQKPPDAGKEPVDVALTLVDGARAYETRMRLDAAAATP